jgi:hypothetical protein
LGAVAPEFGGAVVSAGPPPAGVGVGVALPGSGVAVGVGVVSTGSVPSALATVTLPSIPLWSSQMKRYTPGPGNVQVPFQPGPSELAGRTLPVGPVRRPESCVQVTLRLAKFTLWTSSPVA